jgi:hypothetical protein
VWESDNYISTGISQVTVTLAPHSDIYSKAADLKCNITGTTAEYIDVAVLVNAKTHKLTKNCHETLHQK